jgi:outer membrane biosynthesis protein TonB
VVERKRQSGSGEERPGSDSRQMEATFMKALGIISTTALFLLLGANLPAFAQEEHQDEGAKPAQHEEQAKPAARQEQAKPQKQEEQAKPAKQEQAKPEKQQQEAKPQKQEQQAKSQEQHQQQQAKGQQQQQENQHQQQVKTQQNEEKSQQHEQANGQAQQSQGKYARNGQKDRDGHEYNESRFGPNHHARFEENGGRYYNGRREYSYGGYWFYAGAYPAWFYQQDVYFILGADGLWYAVAYNDRSLTFQVNIG